MGRTRRVTDWSLTLALPDTDIKEVPEWLENRLKSEDVTRFVVVAEKAKHWHIHAGFSTRREYNSDYKLWFTNWIPGHESYDIWRGPHAVELHHHNDIIQLVGGYCCKSGDDSLVWLGDKGFSQEQIEFGGELYEKSLKKQRIREELARYTAVPREHFLAAVGFGMAELGTSDIGKVQEWLIDAKFAFASSVPGDLRTLVCERYRANYVRERGLREMRPSGEAVEHDMSSLRNDGTDGASEGDMDGDEL